MELALNKISDTQWRLTGHVNVNTITAIINPGYAMIDAASEGQALTLDLSDVAQADSASVALLIDWLRYANRQGKNLVFTHLPEKMKDIISVSNLHGIL